MARVLATGASTTGQTTTRIQHSHPREGATINFYLYQWEAQKKTWGKDYIVERRRMIHVMIIRTQGKKWYLCEEEVGVIIIIIIIIITTINKYNNLYERRRQWWFRRPLVNLCLTIDKPNSSQMLWWPRPCYSTSEASTIKYALQGQSAIFPR